MNCSLCRTVNRDGVRFCTRCGAPLHLFCLRCHTPAMETDQYCGGCGNRLALGSGSPPLPVLTSTSRTTPPTLSPPRTTGNVVDMESERKNVTVLFADISGFTAMSEKMDPEAVTDVMNGCLKMLADIVMRYEGHVDKFIGDCIMAIFGAPITHENDPELAIRAALDMKREMEEYNRRLPIKLEKPLTLHTGINSGMVIAGGVGSDQKMEYTVMGDTVNLASRLESIAKSGQIFISVYTYNQTRNLFDFVKHDPIKVKGKKDPVAVYEVLRAKSQKAMDRKPGQMVVPLVGRDQELRILQECADKLMSGQGQAVFLISDPGIGKSRIKFEVRNHLKSGDTQIIDGICRSFSRSTSYYVFSEILKHLFNIDSEDLAEAVAQKVTTNLPLLLHINPDNLDTETREAMVFLGSILGINLGEEYDIPMAQMDAQEIKMASFRAFAWFFKRMARNKPLVLVMEDLHYADASSVELINFLFDSLRDAPIMLLLLLRPVKDHPSAKLPMIAHKTLGERATEITFQQLTPDQCDQMVQHLLQSATIPTEILELVRDRADGNPMYIEEIVRNLEEEEVIRRDEQGTIQIVKNLAEIAIPSSIQGMIIARIDKLQNEPKEILHTAAVIGPVFKLALLRRICDVRGVKDPEERLNQFVEMGIVFESKSFPEIEYSFRNILIQESIYSTLLQKKLKEMHAAVAGVIEELYSSRLEDHYEILARHYQRAGERERALDFLVRSGLKAKKAYANPDAVIYFNQAIELASDMEATPVSLGEILVHLSEVQELAGEMQAAIASRQRAVTLEKEPRRQADIIRNIGRIHEKLGSRDEALAVYQQAQQLLVGEPDALETGLLLLNQSWIMNSMGQSDSAVELANRALGIFETHKARDAVAMACNNLGVIHEHRGDFDQATAFSQRSLQIFSELGNRRQTANLYLSLGFLHTKKGELATALDYFSKSSQIMERIGNPFGAGTALMSQGRCSLEMGETDAGEAALLAAMRIHRKLDLKRKIVANALVLAELYLDKKDPASARTYLEEAKRTLGIGKEQADLARTLRLEARLILLEGRRPEDKFREAIALFTRLGLEKEAADTQNELVRYESAST
ncbi:MAG: tetratricopeptide repeat protein [Magnetococcales bacterium]|nr:tetratricopeptide repeat protein [Magnetococcales bacterium]